MILYVERIFLCRIVYCRSEICCDANKNNDPNIWARSFIILNRCRLQNKNYMKKIKNAYILAYLLYIILDFTNTILWKKIRKYLFFFSKLLFLQRWFYTFIFVNLNIEQLYVKNYNFAFFLKTLSVIRYLFNMFDLATI